MNIPGLCIFEGLTNFVQKVSTGAFIMIVVLAKAKGMSSKQETLSEIPDEKSVKQKVN